MADEKALVPIEQKRVLFYEDEITAVLVQKDQQGQVYVPIRPICDFLGLDWSAQRQRARRNPVLSETLQGVVITTTPSKSGRGGGPQEMTCLPLDYLNGWLFGINANLVKSELRDRIIRYQRECYRVLSEAFQEGRLTADPTFDELLETDSDAVQAYKMALAIVKLARNQVLLEGRLDNQERELTAVGERLDQVEATLGQPDRYVTQEQASQISQAVKAVAIAQGKKSKRNEFGACYGELYRKYGITSYKMLPANKFEDAMHFLTNWHQSLEGSAPF
jgi:hypothetical protein